MTPSHTGQDTGPGRNDDLLTLAGTTATALADALELVAELPSTPQPVAAAAHDTASELSQQIAEAGRNPAEVDVPAGCVVAAAGLLALVGAMPSTPPAVASDATAWSSEVWELLEEEAGSPEPGASTG